MPNFQYQPLDQTASEIRLVSFLPKREPNEPPRLELLTISLRDENHVAYFTLSYTWGKPCHGLPSEWGDSSKTYPLSLNNCDFEVHANLNSFLMHIREIKLTNEPLWIDAICINQKDGAERNSQVQLMGSIYKQGYCTIIWLGPEAQNSGLALDKMLEIGEASELRHKNNLTLYSETADREKTVAAIEAEIGSDPQLWVAICRVFDRTWWQRAWVLQEVIVSVRSIVIICGSATASFSAAMSTFGLVDELYERNVDITPAIRKILGDTEEFLSNIRTFRSLWESKWSRPLEEDLLEILVRVRGQSATDPRDKIYAGLGLSVEGPMVTPDYDATVKQIYASFARRYIEKHNSLNILASCVSLKEEFVSWAPNWTETSQSQHFPKNVDFPGRNQAVYNASNNIKVQAKFSLNSMILTLAGCKIDVLLRAGDEATYWRKSELLNILRLSQDPRPFIEQGKKRMSQANESWKALINQYGHSVHTLEEDHALTGAEHFVSTWSRSQASDHHPKCLHFVRYLHSNDSIAAAFESTLRADLKVGVKRQPSTPGEGTVRWEAVTARRSGVFVPMGPDTTNPQIQWEPEETNLVPSMAFERKFFVSATGYIGLARGAQEGDIICVFLGSEVPHLIRPKENGHFLLIGEAYVHGLMDGEALEGYGEGRKDFEEIILD